MEGDVRGRDTLFSKSLAAPSYVLQRFYTKRVAQREQPAMGTQLFKHPGSLLSSLPRTILLLLTGNQLDVTRASTKA